MRPTEVQAVFRGRFFTALDIAESRLGLDRSVEALAMEVACHVPVGMARSVTHWDPNTQVLRLTRSRRLVVALNWWIRERSLRVAWARDIALFTAACLRRRPESLYWRVPPILDFVKWTPLDFVIVERGWQPLFETEGEARMRLSDVFRKTLRDHIGAAKPSAAIPLPREKKAETYLQWTALHQVHQFSATSIAREWNLGNETTGGRSGRANVDRTIKRWKALLGLPNK